MTAVPLLIVLTATSPMAVYGAIIVQAISHAFHFLMKFVDQNLCAVIRPLVVLPTAYQSSVQI